MLFVKYFFDPIRIRSFEPGIGDMALVTWHIRRFLTMKIPEDDSKDCGGILEKNNESVGKPWTIAVTHATTVSNDAMCFLGFQRLSPRIGRM